MTNEKLNTGDVFRSFLVENADYGGDFELPKIKQAALFPKKQCRFQKQWLKLGTILTAGLCSMSTT